MTDLNRGTTTVTLSIPKDFRSFFDSLTDDGYNRSQLMLKMAKILESLYLHHKAFPGGVPRAIEFLGAIVDSPSFKELKTKDAATRALFRSLEINNALLAAITPNGEAKNGAFQARLSKKALESLNKKYEALCHYVRQTDQRPTAAEMLS